MSVPYPKGGGWGWTCVKDHIIHESINTNLSYYLGLFIHNLMKRKLWGLERCYMGILICSI